MGDLGEVLSDGLSCCLWSGVSLSSSGLEAGPCEDPGLHLAQEICTRDSHSLSLTLPSLELTFIDSGVGNVEKQERLGGAVCTTPSVLAPRGQFPQQPMSFGIPLASLPHLASELDMESQRDRM